MNEWEDSKEDWRTQDGIHVFWIQIVILMDGYNKKRLQIEEIRKINYKIKNSRNVTNGNGIALKIVTKKEPST